MKQLRMTWFACAAWSNPVIIFVFIVCRGYWIKLSFRILMVIFSFRSYLQFKLWFQRRWNYYPRLLSAREGRLVVMRLDLIEIKMRKEEENNNVTVAIPSTWRNPESSKGQGIWLMRGVTINERQRRYDESSNICQCFYWYCNQSMLNQLDTPDTKSHLTSTDSTHFWCD